MDRALRIVGLIGGISSGKSAVAAELARLGAEVLDADRLAHEELADPAIQEQIRAEFGKEVFADDRSLNRKKLAAIVFADVEKRRRLEKMIHPGVRRRIHQALDTLRQDGKTPMAVLDVPLLLEGGLSELCDRIVFVDTPEADRVQRARDSRGWTAEELAAREKNQMSLAEKKARADLIVPNAGSLGELRQKIQPLFSDLMKD